MTNQALNEYTDWMQSYKWDGFLTVRIPPATSPRDAPDLIKQLIVRPLCRYLHARIGALLVVSYGHGMHKPHVHVALCCPGGQLTTRLQDAANYLTSTKSIVNTHAAALDLINYIPERHDSYFAKHVVSDTDVDFYDLKLLHQIRS